MDIPSPLWRVPSSGGTPVKVLDGVVRGAFAVLDRGIYYIDRSSREGALLDDPPLRVRRIFSISISPPASPPASLVTWVTYHSGSAPPGMAKRLSFRAWTRWSTI